MRTKHVETYQFRNGSWYATTTDIDKPDRAFGSTETEALANLVDTIYDTRPTWAEAWEELY